VKIQSQDLVHSKKKLRAELSKPSLKVCYTLYIMVTPGAPASEARAHNKLVKSGHGVGKRTIHTKLRKPRSHVAISDMTPSGAIPKKHLWFEEANRLDLYSERSAQACIYTSEKKVVYKSTNLNTNLNNNNSA
jgi:hypothetical protein